MTPVRRIEAWEIPENGDPDRGVWITAQVICAVCNREWVAVFPQCATQLECTCGHMNHAPEKR